MPIHTAMADIRAEPAVDHSSETLGSIQWNSDKCLTSMVFKTKDFTTAGSALISAIT